MNLEVADVANPCQFIKLHVGVEHSTELLIHDLLFVERVADAHNQSAIDLALGGLHIDDQSTILHSDHSVHSDDARFNVHRNVGHLHAADALIDEAAGA